VSKGALELGPKLTLVANTPYYYDVLVDVRSRAVDKLYIRIQGSYMDASNTTNQTIDSLIEYDLKTSKWGESVGPVRKRFLELYSFVADHQKI
jgi:hypothetical protein